MAFSEARRHQHEVRPDWSLVNKEMVRYSVVFSLSLAFSNVYAKMDVTLWHKFTQHQDLKAELLATGDAELVEVCR